MNYWPLFTTEDAARALSQTNTAHTHEFEIFPGVVYYMPSDFDGTLYYMPSGFGGALHGEDGARCPDFATTLPPSDDPLCNYDHCIATYSSSVCNSVCV
mgnify:FL=1